jgi:hypothetical protein
VCARGNVPVYSILFATVITCTECSSTDDEIEAARYRLPLTFYESSAVCVCVLSCAAQSVHVSAAVQKSFSRLSTGAFSSLLLIMMQSAAEAMGVGPQHQQQQPAHIAMLGAAQRVADRTLQSFERSRGYNTMMALAFEDGDLLVSEDDFLAVLPVVWSTLIDDCLTSPCIAFKAVLWLGCYLFDAAPVVQNFDLDEVFHAFAELMMKHAQDMEWLNACVCVMQVLIEMRLRHSQLARHASALAECVVEGLKAQFYMVRKLAAR